ncbi:hypothetical protein [Bradyrhizobium sp. SZCCHNRI1009]|uniref:hypothetical protein n=1 Tax=Bradyrhizobium sp. SZCCHNRI1009 TaxID=3057277 RepID=UPI002916FAD8|nr:hypothetical protein [Bradyrhizobium sp. SZCCHNRI1009]
MSVTRAARRGVFTLLALVVLSGHRAEAAFDYARYKEAGLDDLLALPRPAKGVDIKTGAPFKLEVILASAGGPCQTGFLKKSMAMSGFDQVEKLGVSNCITVRSSKGRELKVFVQDIVYGFLPREVKVGGKLTLYAVHIYTSRDPDCWSTNSRRCSQPRRLSSSRPKPEWPRAAAGRCAIIPVSMSTPGRRGHRSG